MRSDLVDLATSDGLIGPDWTMNIEVCDAVNRDPRQAKEVVKSLKKKINSKNSKVQLLALTLLETLIKNCGDIVHMHVAERDIPHEMVKIVKKKPDFHVKEKILILIDTWQEVFGGPRARYPQYFGAYQELLNYGMVFPQRTENSAPIFTPPQTQPISHPRPMRSPDYPQQAHGSSTAHGISVLSLTEIQNARGIMDVLTEMLNALDPANREGLRQEVIIDLVQQCHSYKQRVVHLVNTTSDEALLQLSLSLNDDLERLLAKHDAIASGTAVQLEKSKPSLDIGAGKTKTTPVETDASTSSQSPVEQLLLPAQSSSDKNVKTNKALVKMDPHMDLLSGDDINAQTTENSLALVPVTKSLPISASDQNVLALADMFAQNDNAHNNNTPFDSHSSYSVSQATTGPQILKSQQAVLHSDAGNSNTAAEWNSQNTQPLNSQQQSHTFGLSSQVDEALPPPPWETPTEQNEHISQHIQTPPIDGTYPQQIQSPSVSGMYPQHMHIPPQVPTLYSYPVQGEQMVGAYQYPMQSHQMTNIPLQPQYLQNQMGGVYPYTSQAMAQQYYNQSTHPNPYPTPNDLSQRFHDFSMQGNSSQITASSLSVQSSHQEPSKSVDNFFGDLVSMAKSKPNKPPSTNQST